MGEELERLALCLVEKLVEVGYNSMLVWVLAKNPYHTFYEKLGGVHVRSQQIEIGEAIFEEVAHGWKSFDRFNEGTFFVAPSLKCRYCLVIWWS